MSVAITENYQLGSLSIEFGHPRIAKFGEAIELSLTTWSKEEVDVRTISILISTKLKSGAVWKQKNSYDGRFGLKPETIRITFAVPHLLASNVLNVEVTVENRYGESLVKKVDIALVESFEELINPDIVAEKGSLQKQVELLNRKMDGLKKLNKKLIVQVDDLKNKLETLSEKSYQPAQSTQSTISRIANSMKAVLPVRIEIDSEIKSYLKSNPGAPFIISFIALLVSAAVWLVRGNSELADQLAVYAYYLLVFGVIAQIVSFVVRRKETDQYSASEE